MTALSNAPSQGQAEPSPDRSVSSPSQPPTSPNQAPSPTPASSPQPQPAPKLRRFPDRPKMIPAWDPSQPDPEPEILDLRPIWEHLLKQTEGLDLDREELSAMLVTLLSETPGFSLSDLNSPRVLIPPELRALLDIL